MLEPTQAKERLERNLSLFSSFCRPGLITWPSAELLREIDDDVLTLANQCRVRVVLDPFCKTFLKLDKKVKTLRLKSHIDNLIGRARKLLPGESELNKIVRLAEAGKAQNLVAYRDMVLDPQKLAELLKNDRQMVVERYKAWPLVMWVCLIGHPLAKDLDWIGQFFPTEEERKVRRRQGQTYVRVFRHRFRNRVILD